MNYLIMNIKSEWEPFYTNWFDAENNFVKHMVVFNLLTHQWTDDGKNWNQIEEDHL